MQYFRFKKRTLGFLAIFLWSYVLVAHDAYAAEAPPPEVFFSITPVAAPTPTTIIPKSTPPASDNTCQGKGFSCQQYNTEKDDTAVCATHNQVPDTSKTCGTIGSDKPEQVCCVDTDTTRATTDGNTLPAISVGSVQLENPMKADSIPEALSAILGSLQGIIVVLALIFLIIGALLYITSSGDEGRIKLAKGALFAALIGLAIGIAAPAFLGELGTVLGWKETSPAISGALTLSQILMNTLNFLLSIIGILAIIMLIIGSLSYLSSAGDDKRIDTAKNIIRFALIGIVVAFGSLIFIKTIAGLFG